MHRGEDKRDPPLVVVQFCRWSKDDLTAIVLHVWHRANIVAYTRSIGTSFLLPSRTTGTAICTFTLANILESDRGAAASTLKKRSIRTHVCPLDLEIKEYLAEIYRYGQASNKVTADPKPMVERSSLALKSQVWVTISLSCLLALSSFETPIWEKSAGFRSTPVTCKCT